MLIILAAKSNAEANDASPPYLFKNTTPRIAGGIAARIVIISFQREGKPSNEAKYPPASGLRISFNKTTINKGMIIFLTGGNLNIKPTESIATGVSADANTCPK